MTVKTESITAFAADHIQMEYRGRVFGRRVSTEDVAVDPSTGTIRAYDDVAGHWTTCHNITDRGRREILRAAGCK